MLQNLEIDGKTLLPLKEAALSVSYTRDYVTRLAREGKIFATVVGRQWFIDLASLQSYVENINLEQQIRKKQLSEQRKQDLEIRDLHSKKQKTFVRKSQSSHYKAVLEASMVLLLGVTCGWAAYTFTSYSTEYKILAQVSDTESDIEAVLPNSQTDSLLENSLNSKHIPDVNVANNYTESGMKIESMGNVSNGVLLFPSGVSSSTVEDLFSDKVKITQQSDGTSVIELLDKEGLVKDTKSIPVVAVPVDLAQ